MSIVNSARGTVLILVLVVVAILSLVAASQVFVVRSEMGGSIASQRGHQARAAAMSGINRAMALLAASPDDIAARTDNPSIFQSQPVTDPAMPGDAWLFTIWADKLDEAGGIRYGLEDESGKININIAPPPTLKALGLSDDQVQCLQDYRGDPNGDQRSLGAKQDYYDNLPHPYKMRSGPLATLEELLLVKGFNGSTLYGEDANRNGMLEDNENDGDASFPLDNADGVLDRGLRVSATAISYEPNVDSRGQKRVNINTADAASLASQLQGRLDKPTIDFLVAMRQAGLPALPDPSALIGLQLPAQGQNQAMQSPVNTANIVAVMDCLTTGGKTVNGQEILFGRVNISTAPKAVLAALPGLDDTSADKIIDARNSLEGAAKASSGWIYAQNVVSPEVFKQLAPLVTARGYQFRVRSFGYSLTIKRFCVLEAVIDIASGRPKITYLRDLTRLGVPFTQATQ